MSRNMTVLQLAGNWFLMLLVAGIAAAATVNGNTDIPLAARQMVLAASCILAGFLLPGMADEREPSQALSLARWCLLVAAGCFLLMLPHALGTPRLVNSLYVSLGVFVLLLLIWSLYLLAVELLDNEPAASLLVTLLAVACSTVPLWLGPMAERHASIQHLVDAIVAASPLSYLSLLSDYDYLRGSWFYQHSPFGGLRYQYPSILSLTGTYLVLTGLLLTARWRIRQHGRQTSALFHDNPG